MTDLSTLERLSSDQSSACMALATLEGHTMESATQLIALTGTTFPAFAAESLRLNSTICTVGARFWGLRHAVRVYWLDQVDVQNAWQRELWDTAARIASERLKASCESSGTAGITAVQDRAGLVDCTAVFDGDTARRELEALVALTAGSDAPHRLRFGVELVRRWGDVLLTSEHERQFFEGLGLYRARQWRRAEQSLRECIRFREVSAYAMIAHHLLARIQAHLTRWRDAIPHLQRSLELNVEFGTRHGEAQVRHSLGRALTDARRPADAVEQFYLALDELERSGDDHGMAIVLHSLGRAYALNRDYDLSTTSLEESDSLLGVLGDERGRLLVANSLAVTLLERDSGSDVEQAADLLRRAIRTAHSMGDRSQAAALAAALGRALRVSGSRTLSEAVSVLLDYASDPSSANRHAQRNAKRELDRIGVLASELAASAGLAVTPVDQPSPRATQSVALESLLTLEPDSGCEVIASGARTYTIVDHRPQDDGSKRTFLGKTHSNTVDLWHRAIATFDEVVRSGSPPADATEHPSVKGLWLYTAWPEKVDIFVMASRPRAFFAVDVGHAGGFASLVRVSRPS